MFADILVPPEWNKIHGAEWRPLATELRDQFDEMGVDSMVETLDQVLAADQEQNGTTRSYVLIISDPVLRNFVYDIA